MAEIYKVLGQLAPSATTLTDLYTTPANTSVVSSALYVCNRAAAVDSFRVAIRPAGAVISNEHYICYGVPINPNDTIIINGITLATTDVVTVYAGTANLSFSLCGAQLTT